jgi:hypothetical protein
MSPRGTDFVLFFYLTFFFSFQICLLGLKLNMQQIKDDWPKHRCNPVYMPFADDIEQNFVYCMQNTVTSFSPFLLEPLHELTKSIADIASTNMFSINALRIANTNFRSSMGFNFSGIMDSMLNLGITFQKNSIAVQDIIGKIVGIAFSIMYIVQTTLDTFQSTWAGPPGQLVRKMGSLASCFHPNTNVVLKNGCKRISMLKQGDILSNGSVVLKKLVLVNALQEPFYILFSNQKVILVTGSHKLYSNKYQQFVHVCQHEDALLTSYQSEFLVTLITSDHKIILGKYEFTDWDDDDF